MFVDPTKTTFFRRGCYSPDGALFAAVAGQRPDPAGKHLCVPEAGATPLRRLTVPLSCTAQAAFGIWHTLCGGRCQTRVWCSCDCLPALWLLSSLFAFAPPPFPWPCWPRKPCVCMCASASAVDRGSMAGVAGLSCSCQQGTLPSLPGFVLWSTRCAVRARAWGAGRALALLTGACCGLGTAPGESQALFVDLDYRMVLAVATTTSVLFYDTQQTAPFAMVANLHLAPITDVAWYGCRCCCRCCGEKCMRRMLCVGGGREGHHAHLVASSGGHAGLLCCLWFLAGLKQGTEWANAGNCVGGRLLFSGVLPPRRVRSGRCSAGPRGGGTWPRGRGR
jgi:hypothetical protein